jgi:uncharacterized protein (DUF2147 family)
MRAWPVVFTAFLCIAASARGADVPILGEWVTAEAKSKVRIEPCGNQLCGRIVHLKEPRFPADDKKGMAGLVKVDRENPDQRLRSQPILGLQILQGFKPQPGPVWEGGTIYDPENGNTYKCRMTLDDKGQLQIRGYIGFSWIGRTTVWVR